LIASQQPLTVRAATFSVVLALAVACAALQPASASATTCPGGVCPNAPKPLGTFAWPGSSVGSGYAIKPPVTTAAPVGETIAPAASGIWPFSTGMLGGSFNRVGAPPAAAPQQAPHPAVARIIAQDRDSMSLGSGTLIYVTEKHGLVLTNWHVVRDAVGPIEVVFPDGFRSGATVVKVDATWDLAALGIWRPSVEPVPLANSAPLAGEPLTIAGYGAGNYRAVTGRRGNHLVSPAANQPPEMLEIVGAEARQGDSGGPIFNQQGQLAGVLFGAARGQTIGSYCERVHTFLVDVTPVLDRQRALGGGEMLASAAVPDGGAASAALIPPPEPAAAAWASSPGNRQSMEAPARQAPSPALADNWNHEDRVAPHSPRRNDLLDTGLADARNTFSAPSSSSTPVWSGSTQPLPLATAGASGSGSNELYWQDFVGHSRGEQAKSMLAAIGIISILLFASRVMLAGS